MSAATTLTSHDNANERMMILRSYSQGQSAATSSVAFSFGNEERFRGKHLKDPFRGFITEGNSPIDPNADETW